jgi:hypothetical protein
MTGHLIHIGYPKSGSNALRRWFARHPQLAFREGGIAGLDNVYALSRQAYAPPAEARWRVTSSEGLASPTPFVGKAAADYDILTPEALRDAQERAAKLLAELFPNATILMVTRGFRSSALSSYSQFVRMGGVTDFDTYQRTRSLYAIENYDRVLGYYRAAFGADRVIAMPYELLRDDAKAFMSALEARLGLNHAPLAMDRVNESLSPEELYWYPRLTRLVRALPIGGALGERLHRAYLRAAFGNRARPLISLLRRLRPHGRITAAMVAAEHLEGFHGTAETLRDSPLYSSYLEDYLL